MRLSEKVGAVIATVLVATALTVSGDGAGHFAPLVVEADRGVSIAPDGTYRAAQPQGTPRSTPTRFVIPDAFLTGPQNLPTPLPIDELRRRENTIIRGFEGWEYAVGPDREEPGGRRLSIKYDNRSVDGLKRFAAANRALAAQLAREGVTRFPVFITLRQPLPLEQFDAWAGRHLGLAIERYDVRVTGPDGSTSTMILGPQGGVLVPWAQVERLRAIGAGYGQTNVRGVFAIKGKLLARSADALLADPAVFVADVTEEAARRHAGRHIAGLDPNRIQVVQHEGLFLAMERLGLEHFR